MKKEYAVGVKDSKDLAGLEHDLLNATSIENIPDTKVTLTDARPASSYMSHFLLTEQEAENLRKDSRVRFVEDLEEELTFYPHGIQTGTFSRNIFNSADTSQVNYGLQRCNMERNYFKGGSSIVEPPEGLTPNKYTYGLDGTGVDIVIWDDGIEKDHPEFLDDSGVSRVQEIDWSTFNPSILQAPSDYYTQHGNHGTQVASIIAGRKHGWAKNAHIYIAKTGYFGISQIFLADAIRVWHKNKTNPLHAQYTGRPTIINISGQIGTSSEKSVANINYYKFSDSEGDVVTLTDLEKRKLLNLPENSDTFTINAGSDIMDAEFQDLIDAGIHVVKSAGNAIGKIVPSNTLEYGNLIYWGERDENFDETEELGTPYQYLRPTSPHSPDDITVGNVAAVGTFDAPEEIGGSVGGSDEFIQTCHVGEAVSMFAPGTGCVTAVASRAKGYATRPWEIGSNFHQAVFRGTSASAAQVSGVCALHLQTNPNLTPQELKERIVQDGKSVMVDDTGTTTELGLLELAGANNKFLFNRYNKVSLKTEGTFTGPVKGLTVETS